MDIFPQSNSKRNYAQEKEYGQKICANSLKKETKKAILKREVQHAKNSKKAKTALVAIGLTVALTLGMPTAIKSLNVSNAINELSSYELTAYERKVYKEKIYDYNNNRINLDQFNEVMNELAQHEKKGEKDETKKR